MIGGAADLLHDISEQGSLAAWSDDWRENLMLITLP